MHAEIGGLLEDLGIGDVPTPEAVAADLRVAAAKIEPFVRDTGRMLRDHLAGGGSLLAEGAHGAMLDLSAGTYPFVTSSCCTSAGVAARPSRRTARSRILRGRA